MVVMTPGRPYPIAMGKLAQGTYPKEDMMLEIKRDWKAIFTDIDGTLLNSAREVSAKTREALRRCAREGVRIVLSSSRSPQGIEPIVSANDLVYCSVDRKSVV